MKQTFIDSVLDGVKISYEKYNILPSLIIAQAILESGWGRSQLAKEGNNLFGIKADKSWTGDKVLIPTKEFINGKWQTINAYFRKYNSLSDAVIDHAVFLSKPRYQSVKNTKDYNVACYEVWKAGYATDPKYPSKLIQIIKENELYKYDAGGVSNMLKIKLDAGHGQGENRGSVYGNEGDNTYNFSLVFKQELEKYEGVEVSLTRNKISDNPSLSQRSANGKGYDLFLSLHSNAADSKVRGSEIFDSVEKPNKQLANALCTVISKAFNHNNRGVKYKEGSKKGYNYYGVLRFNPAKSSMIVEYGFHTNEQDCKYFVNNYQKLAEVQANEIAYMYGLKKKNKPKGVEKQLTESEVRKIVSEMLRPSVNGEKTQHWADGSYNGLIEKGIEIHDKKFADVVVRGELFAMENRILDNVYKKIDEVKK